MTGERALKRSQLAVFGEPFNRFHRCAVEPRGREEAGTNGLTIDEHGAAPASTLLADGLRARKVKVVAQRGEQAHGPISRQ